MKPSKILSRWLFKALAGTFVEGTTLYVGAAEAKDNVLTMNGEVTGSTLSSAGYSITDGRVYPLATKEDVKTPYVVYDSIETLYERTKDGTVPSAITARVLCVDKSCTAVEAIADAVEATLADAYIEGFDDSVVMTSRRCDYDAGTAEFLEEIRIRIDL